MGSEASNINQTMKTNIEVNSGSMKKSEFKIKIKVGKHEITAILTDNATTRDFVSRLPLTLPMLDLYGREMCYRFPRGLATDMVETSGYEVGDIVYYPPRHSFVIMYAQNGERFGMQKMGKITSGIGIFKGIGNTEMTVEMDDDSSKLSR